MTLHWFDRKLRRFLIRVALAQRIHSVHFCHVTHITRQHYVSIFSIFLLDVE